MMKTVFEKLVCVIFCHLSLEIETKQLLLLSKPCYCKPPTEERHAQFTISTMSRCW